MVDGAYLIYGAEGASCAAAMAYDDRTRTVAGSAGKLSRCSNALLALGADSVEGVGFIETTSLGGLGLGCFKYHFSWHRSTDATTANAAERSGPRRAALERLLRHVVTHRESSRDIPIRSSPDG